MSVKSRKWVELRDRVLKENDGCCCLCGRSKALHGVVLHVDHIKPRSRFPRLQLSINNLQVLCSDCNLGKSNKDDTDWRKLRENVDIISVDIKVDVVKDSSSTIIIRRKSDELPMRTTRGH